jgi:hypothetical protein
MAGKSQLFFTHGNQTPSYYRSTCANSGHEPSRCSVFNCLPRCRDVAFAEAVESHWVVVKHFPFEIVA